MYPMTELEESLQIPGPRVLPNPPRLWLKEMTLEKQKL